MKINFFKHPFSESWKITTAHLNSAFGYLPTQLNLGEEGGIIERYHEWIGENELELALDELEMIGEDNEVELLFWKELFLAAENMNLKGHCSRFKKNQPGRITKR